ncbi:MAG TPA: glycosyltransferase family A protein [Terracidiphilus sp.]|nr:glycosyltransferase family A protein [Terracidiphilus sp.]
MLNAQIIPETHIGAASPQLVEITVCICTYRRLALLEKLLDVVAHQQTENRFTFSCVVVDNDVEASARPVVEKMQPAFAAPMQYAVESERNFARVRNRTLSLAQGDYIAFIDDDEVPQPDWLLQMLTTLERYSADAVLAPVRPYFDREPPKWIVRSRVCERPAHPTGTEIHWRRTRTGNVLFRRSIVTEDQVFFDPAYGSGGEDIDFFRRAAEKGRRFIWCEEAPAYELVPESRLTRGYYLRRALHQGRLSLSYATDRPSFLGTVGVGIKAFIAALLYTLALPVLFLLGDHLGMKYLIKDCHHIARLLAIFGLPRTAKRNF